MKRSTILFAVIIASVFSFIWENNLFAAQDKIIVYNDNEIVEESPLSTTIFELDYDSGAAQITISTIQSSALTVFIIDSDSSAVVSSHYYPEIPGYPNQSYIINAPLIPGEYIIYLTMGGSAWQGMFIVE